MTIFMTIAVMNTTPETSKSPKAEAFPIRIEKAGQVYTLYRTPTVKGGVTYDAYTLVYRQSGLRKRELSSDIEALKKRVDEIAVDIREGRDESVTLRRSERDEYLRSKELAKRTGLPVERLVQQAVNALDVLRATGQPLDLAVRHYAEAVRLLGSDLVVEAARDYIKRHMTRIEPKLVSDAVAEFLREKKDQKRSERHIGTLRSHLNRFAGAMVGVKMASVTTDDLELFLNNLGSISGCTHDNFVRSFGGLFEWAKLKRYVPSDFDEVRRVTRLSTDEDGPIEVYTPGEMRAMLQSADDGILPLLAIGAFAGLRTSEIMRLDWEDVHLENGEPCIVVKKGKVKARGKARRIVPVSENLQAWLKPHVKTGKVWPFSPSHIYKSLAPLTPKAEALLQEQNPGAKLEWRSNALRHSFISYRVMVTKNIPQVAIESGNSPQMIDSNYRELVMEQDAREWFSIFPASKVA